MVCQIYCNILYMWTPLKTGYHIKHKTYAVLRRKKYVKKNSSFSRVLIYFLHEHYNRTFSSHSISCDSDCAHFNVLGLFDGELGCQLIPLILRRESFLAAGCLDSEHSMRRGWESDPQADSRKDGDQLLTPTCGENATEHPVCSLTITVMIKETAKRRDQKKKNK